ncbi:MAG: nicotinate (nicotinamide) nucleotide adenylyltransferase [Alphaproteobacteria bacterium]|nr:nicotinate (nicotinamide) nucleotide adenylyltransferase [Alphaproteobacteria bacterium]
MSVFTPSPHPLSAARWKGLRVGLLGGSFNPAHAGHMHIAKQAMVRLKLDAVWWVVSPGNPLKTKNPVKDFEARVKAVNAFVKHPRMCATDIEGKLKTRYTYDTIKALLTRFPRTQFVWIAGMDNACAFDRWDKWEKLPALMPFVFFDRPPAAAKLKGKRIRQHRHIAQCTKLVARPLKPSENGVFWMLSGKSVNLSSTAIRRKKQGHFAKRAESGV